MKKVVTFGEIMLRLSTPGFTRFVQAQGYDAVFGGGEANVAVSLAQFGLDAYFLTKLPKHEIGEAAVNAVRRYGVRSDYIVRGGDRVGIYFLETGASQRGSKVIYDRAGSAVTTLAPEEIDAETILNGASWFHWTGITPALGETARRTLRALCEAAKARGVTVSADLNYRKKLWSVREARSCMMPLMEFVDVCIANEEDAEKCLGMAAARSDVEGGEIDEAGYADLAKQLKERFGFSAVAITLRESHSASRNGWSAMLLDDRDCKTPTRSKRYDVQIVDRVGGGDSFASGLAFGLLDGQPLATAVEYGAAHGALAMTTPGDTSMATAAEVLRLAAGGSARVDR